MDKKENLPKSFEKWVGPVRGGKMEKTGLEEGQQRERGK